MASHAGWPLAGSRCNFGPSSINQCGGIPLHQIPADILRKELHYSAVALLSLSTMDSIIEAIRLAVELDLPVFGVDWGEIANPEHEPTMIQDRSWPRPT